MGNVRLSLTSMFGTKISILIRYFYVDNKFNSIKAFIVDWRAIFMLSSVSSDVYTHWNGIENM